jgi:formylmethanofuran dehydrogenase subunit C
VVPITNLLIWVDRDFSGVGITFNGDAGKLELEGTIYDPWGEVKVNGGAGDTMSAQIIAYTIKITGNGDFDVNYDADGVVQLSGAGLVK